MSAVILTIAGIVLVAWASYQFGAMRGRVTMYPPMVIDPDKTYVIKVDRLMTQDMAERIKDAFARESGANVVVLGQGYDVMRDMSGDR